VAASNDVTYEEFVAAIERIMPHQDAGLTTREWMELLGMDTTKQAQVVSMRATIRRLLEGGRMAAGHAIRRTIDGRKAQVPVYRLKRGEGNGTER
jgi:hypothetical protein